MKSYFQPTHPPQTHLCPHNAQKNGSAHPAWSLFPGIQAEIRNPLQKQIFDGKISEQACTRAWQGKGEHFELFAFAVLVLEWVGALQEGDGMKGSPWTPDFSPSSSWLTQKSQHPSMLCYKSSVNVGLLCKNQVINIYNVINKNICNKLLVKKSILKSTVRAQTVLCWFFL